MPRPTPAAEGQTEEAGNEQAEKSEMACAPAFLETGDGQQLKLGLLCCPTQTTWRQEHRQDLATYRYQSPGPFTARLRWGDQTAEACVRPGAASVQAAWQQPELQLFAVERLHNQPLRRMVKVLVSGLARGQRLRLDGGAGQVCWIEAQGDGEGGGEWTFSYPKPGAYLVGLDLLDNDGFWLATLGEAPLEITAPLEFLAEEQPQPASAAEALAPTDFSYELAVAASAQPPWLPYRYARPAWSGTRTYTTPGGSQVSRVVGAGTCLSIRAETVVGNVLWYQTGSGDWIPASSVNLITPSELRGVELAEVTIPEPPTPPPTPPTELRQGVVTAGTLNVRPRPGVRADNPPIAQLHAGDQVTIYEEALSDGATWYRIGEGRWVHSAYIRLVTPSEPAPPSPPPTGLRQGVVTATALNVRPRPGVRADNPPIAQLHAGDQVTIYEEALSDGAIWYRIGEGRWVHSAYVRLLETGTRSVALLSTSGDLPAMSLPVGWVVASALNVRARPGVASDNPPIDQVRHNQVFPILEQRTVGSARWYRIGEGRWVEGSWVGVARLKPRPLSIRPDERWVGVCLKEQTAVAYEGDRPVYAALVATGLPGTPTVQGVFRTWLRLPTGKMSGGNPAYGSYYYLEDVTWTCYFYSGYSLHAAYWHDAFGRPRSHGCVNMSPYDAWWIYQWSAAGGPNSPAVYVYWE